MGVVLEVNSSCAVGLAVSGLERCITGFQQLLDLTGQPGILIQKGAGQEQAVVVTLPKVGAGSMYESLIFSFQGVFPPNGAGDMLVEFRQYHPEISMVEITAYNKGIVRVFSLLSADGTLLLFKYYFSI